MKRTGCILSVFAILFVFGCSPQNPVKKLTSVLPTSESERLFYVTSESPNEAGRYYIESVYEPGKKKTAYSFLTGRSQSIIKYDDFSQIVDGLIGNIQAGVGSIKVINLDSLDLSEDKAAVYYLMVYEKNLKGGYYVIELFLDKSTGSWKIDLSKQEGTRAIIPFIMQGNLDNLTRKNLNSIRGVITTRIESLREQYDVEESQPSVAETERPARQPKPVVKEKSDEESKEFDEMRNVKKETVVGKVYFDLGEFEKAKASFEKVLSINPDDPEAKDYLIKTMERLKEKQQAQDEEALPNSPPPTPVPPVELKTEPLPPAEPKIEPKPQEIIQETKPKTVEEELFETCFNMGKKYYNDGQYRKAILQFQKALGFKAGDEESKSFIKKCERAIQVTPSK